MIELRTSWKHFLWRHRHAVSQIKTVAVSFLAVYGVLFFSFKEDGAIVSAPLPVKTAFIAPQPNIIEQRAPEGPPLPTPLRENIASQISKDISGILEIESEPRSSERKVVVGKGDTLMNLLVKKAAVSQQDAYQVVQALRKVYDPRDLNPGREITVFFHKDPAIADPKFSGIRIEKDIANIVTIDRGDDGRYTATKAEKNLHRTLKAFKGTISNSLYVDAKSAGMPDALILDLIKMYSWNVDFQREVHAGDMFEVMYEEYKTEDGKIVPGKSDILYAKLALGGNNMPFTRFEDAKGVADYYDDKGRSVKKPLMKTPIDGARLSSGYGMRRHPVLGYSKMHKGIDFAAPRGTPIYAAGDGTVAKIGPFSSYGNYIRIRHRAGLETAYAHMKGFKSGLRSGSRVKQGQIIGYVGTTGRSTGPHLHYEVVVNNKQANPASIKLPTGRALKGKELQSFQRVLAQAQEKFNALGRATALAAN